MVLSRAPLFVANWLGADAVQVGIDGDDFVLKNGVNRVTFEAKVAELRTMTLDLASDEENVVLMQGTRDAARATLRNKVEIWRKGAIYALSGSAWESKIPTLPGVNEALKDFILRARKASDMWLDINGATGIPDFSPPLILRDGTTQAAFLALIVALENTAKTLAALENSLPLKRASRDKATSELYALMGLYRDAVQASFEADSPVVLTLPTLQPRDTGHTPDAVELSGTFNPVSRGADLRWTASTDADFDFYRVRLAAGARFKNDDAITLAELQSGVLNYSVEARFLPGGSVSNAVVSVVLTDGREKQSNTVKFEPPL
ncbi:MAG TPA: hypothetical protein VF627_01705 [Abditibacterium sp.]|jgi:hypothetical protein